MWQTEKGKYFTMLLRPMGEVAMLLVYFLLLLMSFIFFWLSYGYFNGKVEIITMWKSEEYNKLQGIYSFILGTLWLLTLVSIVLVNVLELDSDVLTVWRIWFMIIMGISLIGTIHTSRFKDKCVSIGLVVLVILVVLVVGYIEMPAKTIFELTGWTANSQKYAKIVVREIGMDNNGEGLSITYETEDNNLIEEVLGYLNNYQLKRWYEKAAYYLEPHEKSYEIWLVEDFGYKKLSFIKDYVSVFDGNNDKNYKAMNQGNVDQDYFQGLLQQMNVRDVD